MYGIVLYIASCRANFWLCLRYQLKVIFAAEGGQESDERRVALAPALQPPPPAQVMLQVLGGDAMEPPHPLLEPTVVGVDVLDVVDPGDDPDTGGQVHGPMGQAERTTSTGTWSRPVPRAWICLPRLRAGRSRWRWPLREWGKKVSSASTMPRKRSALVSEDPRRNRCRQRKLVVLSIPHRAALARTVRPWIRAAQ